MELLTQNYVVKIEDSEIIDQLPKLQQVLTSLTLNVLTVKKMDLFLSWNQEKPGEVGSEVVVNSTVRVWKI